MNVKHLIKACLLAFFLSLLFSCSGQGKISNSGMVISRLNFWDSASNEYVYAEKYWPDLKIWYKDSLIIEEIIGLSINQDIYGVETRTVAVSHYTFIDLRTKSFYDYKCFSDTATLIKKYTQPDSVCVFGGWNFYAPHSLGVVDLVQGLSDTIINRVEYKRIRIISTINSLKETRIVYLRCDKKSTMFQFDKELSKKLECPIVRMDDSFYSPEIHFLSESLTPEEIKVFSAWEKYAHGNPVNN